MTTFYKIKDTYLCYEVAGVDFYETPLVNGESVPKGSRFTVAILPKSVVAQKQTRHLVSTEKNGVVIDTAEWEQVKAELYLKYDKDDEVWESLDAEFAYKKHCEGVKHNYEMRTETRDLPFKIVELEDAELPPFTEPIRLINGATNTKNVALYEYKPVPLRLAIESGKEFGFEFLGEVANFVRDPACTELQWHLPSHSAKSLQFIKTGLGYTDYKRINAIRSAVGTVEECRKVHEANMENLRSFWGFEKSKVSQKAISRKSATSTLAKLEKLLVDINSICGQKRDADNLTGAKRRTAELISDMKLIIQEETQ